MLPTPEPTPERPERPEEARRTPAPLPAEEALASARRTATYREIAAQAETLPETWRRLAARGPVRAGEAWTLFTGCGSSFYLAEYAAALATGAARRPALAWPASRLWLAPGELEPWQERLGPPLVVGISRSGETTELLRALETARRRGLRTLALTCRPGAPVREVASEIVGLPHVREASVVMTHSFSNLALALAWLVLGGLAGGAPGAGAALAGLARLVQEAPARVAEGERRAAAWAAGRPRHFVFLGAGALFAVAREAALKVEETSQLPAEAYPPLELRHGPQAAVGEGSLVLLLGAAGREEEALLEEQRRLGARAERLGSPPQDEGGGAPWWSAHAALPALQFLALFRAVQEGRDPDRPRHLTQAVRLAARPPAGEEGKDHAG